MYEIYITQNSVADTADYKKLHSVDGNAFIELCSAFVVCAFGSRNLARLFSEELIIKETEAERV